MPIDKIASNLFSQYFWLCAIMCEIHRIFIMHQAFTKPIASSGIAPIIETGGNEIANSQTKSGVNNYGNENHENDFNIDNFYQGLRNLVFLCAILTIILFCRFCVLWIGAEDNNYMMLEIPFMK